MSSPKLKAVEAENLDISEPEPANKIKSMHDMLEEYLIYTRDLNNIDSNKAAELFSNVVDAIHNNKWPETESTINIDDVSSIDLIKNPSFPNVPYPTDTESAATISPVGASIEVKYVRGKYVPGTNIVLPKTWYEWQERVIESNKEERKHWFQFEDPPGHCSDIWKDEDW
jgi:hypothetical protein